MPDTLLSYYIINFYAVIVCITIFVLVVIDRCKAYPLHGISNNIFQLYFFLVSLGWLVTILRDADLIYFSKPVSACFYIIISFTLLMGLNEKARRRKIALVLSVITFLYSVYVLSITKVESLYLAISIYGILLYSFVSLETYKNLKRTQNLGFTFILVATVGVIISHFIELYLVYVQNEPRHAYGLALIGTGVTFAFVGLGYMAIQLFDKQKQLIDYAMFDTLTGLVNRRGLDYQLGRLLSDISRKKRDLSVIAIDIDHFKKINDNFGHDIGDLILKFIAQQISLNQRNSDICCRYGGEEFIVILPECSEDDAKLSAERLRENVEGISKNFNTAEIAVTVSIGVAHDIGSFNIDHLLKRADKALYKAKETGRNRLCVADAE